MHALPSEGSMHDDELMDQLLRDALTAEVPQLSPGFDASQSPSYSIAIQSTAAARARLSPDSG